MVQRNLIIDNLNINYLQSDNFDGNGCLVFLHGWGSEASHFKGVLDKCSNFVALDLPGFGRSDVPKGVWGTDDYVGFLIKFLQKINVVNPILAGHSFGGSVAIKYAVSNPAKKLILISSAGIREKSFKVGLYITATKIFKTIFYLPGLNLLKNEARKIFYKKIGSEDYLQSGELKDSFKKIIREDIREDIKKVNVPTVMIWGEDDKDTPIANGMLMKELIKNSEIYVIKNAGHFSFIDQPDEFNKIFFRELNQDTNQQMSTNATNNMNP